VLSIYVVLCCVSEFERPIKAANTSSGRGKTKSGGASSSSCSSSFFQQNAIVQQKTDELAKITASFMLRRLQKDVLKSILPPRHEFLLFCRPSSQQRDHYLEITTTGTTTTKTQSAGTGTSDALMKLTALRKLCAHPNLLKKKSRARAEEDHGSTTTNNCNNDDDDDNDTYVKMSGKLVVLRALLEEIRHNHPTDKVVVISNFTSALSVIEDGLLTPHKWSSLRLDGSVTQKDRMALVHRFNRGSPEDSFVFLLSSRAGGCGLNLIGASRLIMFDADWNPANDAQAMARIYRQGQTKPCHIYRMFLSGTVEEVVHQRQISKTNIAILTMDGASGSAGGNEKKNNGTNKTKIKSSSTSSSSCGLTAEELKNCFTLKDCEQCDTKDKLGWMNYGMYAPHAWLWLTGWS
jgi:DNA repair and recombination RAD54-like protein